LEPRCRKLQTTVSANIKSPLPRLMSAGAFHLFDANPSAIPKGLRLQPRVARNEATLGNRQEGQQPGRGCGLGNAPRMVSQPRWGWINLIFPPRVARSSQPGLLGGIPRWDSPGCLNHTRILHSESQRDFAPPPTFEERATLSTVQSNHNPNGCAHASDLCRNPYPPLHHLVFSDEETPTIAPRQNCPRQAPCPTRRHSKTLECPSLIVAV